MCDTQAKWALYLGLRQRSCTQLPIGLVQVMSTRTQMREEDDRCQLKLVITPRRIVREWRGLVTWREQGRSRLAVITPSRQWMPCNPEDLLCQAWDILRNLKTRFQCELS